MSFATDAGDDSARVTAREWQAHTAMVGALERRIDRHDLEMREMVDEVVRGVMERMPVVVEQGAEKAAERVLRKMWEDPQSWRTAFDHLVRHAEMGGNAWLGKRMLVLVVSGLAAAAVTWLVNTGRLK